MLVAPLSKSKKNFRPNFMLIRNNKQALVFQFKSGKHNINNLTRYKNSNPGVKRNSPILKDQQRKNDNNRVNHN